MRKAVLLSVFVLFLPRLVVGQYLPPRFQGKTVNLRLVHDGKYVAGHDAASAGNFVYQLYETPDFYSEEWELQVTANANWYRLFHVASQRYLTLNSFTFAVELQPLNAATEGLYQQFQFVAQTQTDRFKIHTRFQSTGNVDNVLQIADNNGNDGVRLTLGGNVTVGNSDNQKFDLTDLYPPADPGSAVPSLANRFEGRTAGLKSNYYNDELIGINTPEDIYLSPGYPLFKQEFKIEYTNETGWYKIRHKPSGKYVTVMTPIVDGGVVKLKPDAGYVDDQQKFKFIAQPANDYTYKIHSKYSVGAAGFEKALLLEMNPSNSSAPLRLKKNITVGADQWQQFELYQNLPPQAEFTTGAPTVGAGKILQKQYYLSSFESLALLEPYAVGTDTFVRLQSSPVYGQQSEWTFDDGGLYKGAATVRIRYGKTGQYLYVPVSDTNANPTEGMMVKLMTDPGGVTNRRFKFYVSPNGSDSYLIPAVGTFGQTNATTYTCMMNDDGTLCITSDANPYVQSYDKNQRFLINLSMPLTDAFAYAITSKAQGHAVGDSGIDVDNSRLVHSQSATPATLWNFIPTGIASGPDFAFYKIKSSLSGNYIVAAYGNAGAVGTEIHTATADGAGDNYLWSLERAGNYYKIRSKATGKYFSLYNHPDPGNPVYNGLATDAGTEWAITRADYVEDPLIDSVNTALLLDNYSPATNNVFNQDSLKNKLMKNIGLPFQPSYFYANVDQATQVQNAVNTDIPINPAPDFYAVVVSALKWKYNWSQAKVDSAMKNYKFTEPGHRVQVVYALRAYILEHLAPVSNRAAWTYNERELVAYVERRIQMLKANYASRLETSWNDFIIETASGSDLYFDALMGFIPNPNSYIEPDYYIPNTSQSLSLLEYSAICKTYNYKNPNVLAALTSPALSVAGAAIITCGIIKFTSDLGYLASLSKAAFQKAYNLVNKLVQMGWTRAGTTMTEALGSRYGALTLLRTISSVEGASGMATLAIMLLQGIIQYGQEGTAYQKFNDAVVAKVNRLRTTPVNVNTTMAGANLLNRFYLCQDVDFVLATGERFGDGVADVAVFNGNGNWSNPVNWNNGRIPPNPLFSLNPAIAAPDSIIINPLPGGECVIDVNVDAAPPGQQTEIPIVVMPGKTVRIKSGVTLKIKNYRKIN